MNSILFTLLIFNFTFSFAQNCSEQLEPSLNSLPNWLTEKRNEPNTSVNQRCITEALDIYHSWTISVANKKRSNNQTVRGQFAYCDSEESENIFRSEMPVCQSPTYLNVIQNSFHDVMDCFDLDPKLFFPMIALESGFHLNALSVIGEDIGIGQMTAVAIDDVNSNWGNMYSISLTSSTKGSCQRISNVISSNDSTTNPNQYVCALVDVQKNPIKNLVYMAFLTKKNLSRIESHFVETNMKKRLSQLSQSEMTDLDMHKIAEMLTYLAYNKGYPTAIEAFENFLTSQSEKSVLLKSKLEELMGLKSATYLVSMGFKADNDMNNYNTSLQQYSDVLNKIEQTKYEINQLKMTKSLFLVSDDKNSFGEYLKDQQISLYLEFLKKRALAIEERLNVSPGTCSHADYLVL